MLAAARALGKAAAGARALSGSRAVASRNLVELDLYNTQRSQVVLGDRVPSIAPDAWVAPNAVIVGDVDLHDSVSVFYGAVLRGDLNNITVHAFSNIQDRVVLHAARSVPTGMSAATTIGRHASIGSGSLLRSATVHSEAVLGVRCILMEGSVVESKAVLAAGTVVPPARYIPGGQLWAGNPARFVRNLTPDELAELPKIADRIHDTAVLHAEQYLPYSPAYIEAVELRNMLSKGRE